jgi:KDO2-lipid IV(A) lauroyltransferase
MAKKSKSQIWLEYAGVRLLLGFLGALPRSAALFLSKGAAVLAHDLLGGLRRVARRNLEIAFPDMPETERKRITRASFVSLGRVLGEMSQFPKTTPAEIEKLITFEIDPGLLAEYDRAKAEGRGAIITTGHIGNWELFVFAYAAMYEPISYLARPLDNPMIEDLTVALRTRFGNRPINKTNAVMTASKILREGGVLGILADVNAHPKEGVFVPFFGVPACTSSGAAMLALRTNSMIVPMCAVWDEKAEKYRAFHGSAVEPARTGDRKQDVIETTARFTAELEKIIRQYPDQWLWIHKRWKTRPLGEPKLY